MVHRCVRCSRSRTSWSAHASCCIDGRRGAERAPRGAKPTPQHAALLHARNGVQMSSVDAFCPVRPRAFWHGGHSADTTNRHRGTRAQVLGIVLRQLPAGALKQHLVLNQPPTTLRGPKDVDAVSPRKSVTEAELTKQLAAIGSHKKDKCKGKDKGVENFTKPCPTCGKTGHWKRTCWYNPSEGSGNDRW